MRRLVGAVATLALLLVAWPGPAGAAGAGPAPSWSVDPVPNPAGATVSNLGGVSCYTTGGCVSVGNTAASLSSPGAGLVESSNHGTWTIGDPRQPARATSSGLRAVSCVGPRHCVAIGTLSTSSGPGTSFSERWNGTRWSLDRTTEPPGGHGAELLGLSCTAADACTAVGSFTEAGRQHALAERWNGKTWSVQSVPGVPNSLFDRLYGVSCTAAGCVAVGYESGNGNASAYAVSWNASGWHLDVVPEPAQETHSELFAVSCAAAADCTAVGSYGTARLGLMLAESWNGTSWSLETVPEPAGVEDGELSAVSCPSSAVCEAVGYYFTSNLGPPTAFAARLAGSTWHLQTIATPAGTVASTMLGVDCIGLSACTAVGYFQTPTEVLALADRYS